MRIKPMGDKIVIRQLDSDDMTPGGIRIPTVSQRKPMMGDVLAVGQGTLLESGEYAPVECVVGDVVLYGETAGETVEVDGVEYKILRQTELLGIMEKPVRKPPELDEDDIKMEQAAEKIVNIQLQRRSSANPEDRCVTADERH